MDSFDKKNQHIRHEFGENWILKRYKKTFKKLLEDHTTHKNIIWATNSYESMGNGYGFFDEITIEKIIRDNSLIIRPRALKAKEQQTQRIKDKAEVFTPAWICNAQNNLIDEAWFGRPDVFNIEIINEDGSHDWIPTEGNIEFSKEKGKTWRDYVRDVRMEITCGEAPYLVSRYDAVTGNKIEDFHKRVGLLDRKLRVINENVNNPNTWISWAKEALESTYGYEWQGDSLLLARQALLITVMEYYYERWKDELHTGEAKELDDNQLKEFAQRISWNLWQMDGLKYVIPCSCEIQPRQQFSLFDDGENEYEICEACKKGTLDHIGIKPKIRDWKLWRKLKGVEQDDKKKQTDIPFIRYIQSNPYKSMDEENDEDNA